MIMQTLDLKRPNSEKRNPVLRFDIKRILNGWRLDDGIMNNYMMNTLKPIFHELIIICPYY